jgi:hypothetical protein
MARPKSSFTRVSPGSTLNFAATQGALRLQQTGKRQASTDHPDAASDPKGYKNWIAGDVAHGIYPNGDSVDPNQSIVDDVSKNSDVRAVQINLYATLDAKKFGYTWKSVSSGDVGKLKTVGTLMDLVVSHLS